ncbi:uncharacterized protein PgNI_00270 [Pyricularia grisea]|uniref:RRM domain-containing protein n=1 Tax=Pyricularia grisea TaxID=148305 RepID=A0A6P8BK58_PYRGI|nr:uncharacterized protein PgNI_00270 [Pyricularia grisea]TLD17276.1 hypothetical protein PgNI_00270 [Pyricularia grisea]
MASSSDQNDRVIHGNSFSPQAGPTANNSSSPESIPQFRPAGCPSIISSTGDIDEAGARLSTMSLNSSPIRHSYSDYNQESHRPRSSLTDTDCTVANNDSRFQLGLQPSGDVFLEAQNQVGVGNRDIGRLINTAEPDKPPSSVGTSGPLTGTSLTLRPRPSNLSARHHVGGVDAQGVYPYTACVFVANLPQLQDDQSLEAAITREFSKYGTVFVKIRRDKDQMPFAFCQYTKDEDAKAAVDQGRGTQILGRSCRTEMVKAIRTFLVSRRFGNQITLEEARDVLEPFGAISKVEIPDARTQETTGIRGAVLVEFSNFDITRDLPAYFLHNDTYRVETFRPDGLKERRSGILRRHDADEAFLAQYEVDRRSVFVGNLPRDITEEQVTDLFSAIGTVNRVQIIKRTGTPIEQPFGFIEFDRPDTPEAAIAALHGFIHEGSRLRVERKVVKDKQSPRRVPSRYLPRLRTEAVGTIMPPNPVAPATPDASESRFGHLGASSTLPSSPGGAQSATSSAWNWPYPYHTPMQASFNPQNYVAAPPSPYGAQIPLQGMPMTPQATPDSFSQYAAYYSALFPHMSFVPNPLAGNPMTSNHMAAGMAPYYTPAYPSPTTSNFNIDRSVNEGVSSPTRARHNNQDSSNHLGGAPLGDFSNS